MIDQTKIDTLRKAALSDEWQTAADVYLEIALEANGIPESVIVETGPLLRLRDGARLAAAVDGLARRS